MRHTTDEEMEWALFQPQRVAGGWRGALRQAGRLWWSNAPRLTLFNVGWALALFSIVALPAATAMLFFIAHHVNGEGYPGWTAFWFPVRRTFAPALRWALASVAVLALVAGTLWLAEQGGPALRPALQLLWAPLLLGWGALNLFFWPLWFWQPPPRRSLGGTWRASARFLRAQPGPTLLVVGLTALLVLAALRLQPLLFFFTLLPLWPALLATTLVAAYPPEA